MQASAREVKIVDYVNFKKVKHGRRASVQEGRAAAMAIALHIRLEAAEREKAEEEARLERKKAEEEARQERRRQKHARRRHRRRGRSRDQVCYHRRQRRTRVWSACIRGGP